MSTHDARGRHFSLNELRKWLRLHDIVYPADKVDLRVQGDEDALIRKMLDFARTETMPLSLRYASELPPATLGEWKERGLHDVCLCALHGRTNVEAWLNECRHLNIPVRVQYYVQPAENFDATALAEMLGGAAAVNVAYWDHFDQVPPCRGREESLALIRNMNALLRALTARNIEANLLHLPYCLTEEDNRPHGLHFPEFYLDHQQYMKSSYDFAVSMFQRGPGVLEKAVESLLSRRASIYSHVDKRTLPWIMEHPVVRMRLWMLHKLTRLMKWRRKPKPKPEQAEIRQQELAKSRPESKVHSQLRSNYAPHAWAAAAQAAPPTPPESLAACMDEVEEMREAMAEKMGPVCATCRYHRLCSRQSAPLRHQLPGVEPKTIDGQVLASTCASGAARPRYYDPLDRARQQFPPSAMELAEEARHITLKQLHTCEISADSYQILDHFTQHLPGAVCWNSMRTWEYWSTPLTRLRPPFTLALTFGGGIASHIGFTFGRHARIMCPMIDFTHRLILYVNREGFYVLLRDNELVHPTEFENEPGLPPRLAGNLEPRIAIANIDGQILTQTLLLWQPADTPPPAPKPKYSVIIVNSRYTRRLQAALLTLVHQRSFDLAQLEVIVAYIPGLDATDDLLDSMVRAYPQLRLLRSPFPKDCVKSKGFMINESLSVASGDWILLMDADIVLPPDTFERIEAVEEDTHFIAPDGRIMLSPETTSDILLGKIRPWENYAELLERETEIRYREAHGVPIGFFQCVRRELFEKILYAELEHFEASDWHFGKALEWGYGKATRLEGFHVFHLDHGGSQWYGTTKHL